MSENVLDRLKHKILDKSRTSEDNIVTTVYQVMKKFKYTISEMSEMPISTFQILVNEIDRENKEKEKQMKKGKKPMRRR